MSSLTLSGDTSGSVVIQAPAVSGSTALTLPTTNGTIITNASSNALPIAAIQTTSGTANSSTYLTGNGSWASISTAGGLNGAWSNVTATRALSTTYTNSTGYTIMVSVSTSSQTSSIVGYVNGGAIFAASWGGSSFQSTCVMAVPNGATYSVVGGTLASWWEMR